MSDGGRAQEHPRERGRAAEVRAGVTLLKAEGSETTTNSLGIPGPGEELSSYDLFVVMHHWAMTMVTPATQMHRNAAHRGPGVLPWHRWMLIQLEAQLQRVLNDANIGLPFWNWAADGEKPKTQQPNSALWKPNCMGGDGTGVNGAVHTGPFSDSSGWNMEDAADSNGVLRSVDRPLRRGLDTSTGLPNKNEVQLALARPHYDSSTSAATSAGFRDRLEGWIPAASAPYLHNHARVRRRRHADQQLPKRPPSSSSTTATSTASGPPGARPLVGRTRTRRPSPPPSP